MGRRPWCCGRGPCRSLPRARSGDRPARRFQGDHSLVSVTTDAGGVARARGPRRRAPPSAWRQPRRGTPVGDVHDRGVSRPSWRPGPSLLSELAPRSDRDPRVSGPRRRSDAHRPIPARTGRAGHGSRAITRDSTGPMPPAGPVGRRLARPGRSSRYRRASRCPRRPGAQPDSSAGGPPTRRPHHLDDAICADCRRPAPGSPLQPPAPQSASRTRATRRSRAATQPTPPPCHRSPPAALPFGP